MLASMTKAYCAYIMANARNVTLYMGTASDLIKRVYEHRVGRCAGFTRRYGVDRLVWFEQHDSA